VILALLLAVSWSRRTDVAVPDDAPVQAASTAAQTPDVPPPIAAPEPPAPRRDTVMAAPGNGSGTLPSATPATRDGATTSTLRGTAPSPRPARASSVVPRTTPVPTAASSATSPPAFSPAGASGAGTPVPVAAAAGEAPHSTGDAQFIVLSAGDEELSPMSSFATENGPMLPLAEFAAQIGAVLTDDGDRITVDVRADEPVQTTFSAGLRRGQRTQQRTTTPFALQPTDLARHDGQWYASLDALRTITGLDLHFDTRSQSVVITSPRSAIPRYAAALRRMERGYRTADAGDLLAPLRPGRRATISSSGALPTSATLTYSVSQDNSTGFLSAQGTLGAAVLGGGLSVTGTLTNGSQRSTPAEVTWLGGNPLSRWLTQARVGWGAATGLAPWPGYGVSLTNAPFARAMALGTMPLSGTATPGAEIEIQSAGRLLGVVAADDNGQWSSRVPVGFGQNLLDIAAYGPQGVTRRSVLRSLEGEHLPGGRVEYGLTAQRGRRDAATCSLLGCGDLGNADLRWGVSSRVTLRAGASALRQTDSVTGAPTMRMAPYGAVVAAPTGWLQVRQDVSASQWFRSRAIVQPSLAFRADASFENFGPDASSVPFWLITRATSVRSEAVGSITYRPVATDLGRLWVNVLGRRALGTRSTAQVASVSVGGRVAGSLLTVGTDRTVIEPVGLGVPVSRTRFTTSATIPQLRFGPEWLAKSFAAFGVSWTPEESQIPGLNVGLTSTVFGSMLMQVGADWRPGAAPALRLQFQQVTSAAIVMQNFSTARAGETPVTGSTSILGSILMPLNGKPPALTSDLVALRARVRVQAFLDRDNNGLVDPSEERVPELSLLVGTQRAVTDADGVAMIDGLPVLDALMVKPDALYVNAADGQIWVLSGPPPWARLVPYGETLVPLPFVLASQATVLVDGDLRSSTLWITALEHGDAVAMQRPFFADGSAPLGPLVPGRYRIEARRSATDAPLASCAVDLLAGAVAQLRFPSGVSDGVPECVVGDPAPRAP
jgi:hypothetical protein